MIRQNELIKKVLVMSTAATVTTLTAMKYSHPDNWKETWESGGYYINNDGLSMNDTFHFTRCEGPTTSSQNKSKNQISLKKIVNDAESYPVYKSISKWQTVLYKWNLIRYDALPTPRILSQKDPIFHYHKMRKGLKQRELDERKLRELQTEITTLMTKQKEEEEKGDSLRKQSQVDSARDAEEHRMKILKDVMERISEIVNGTGITPQMREDFLVVSECLFILNFNSCFVNVCTDDSIFMFYRSMDALPTIRISSILSFSMLQNMV